MSFSKLSVRSQFCYFFLLLGNCNLFLPELNNLSGSRCTQREWLYDAVLGLLVLTALLFISEGAEKTTTRGLFLCPLVAGVTFSGLGSRRPYELEAWGSPTAAPGVVTPMVVRCGVSTRLHVRAEES